MESSISPLETDTADSSQPGHHFRSLIEASRDRRLNTIYAAIDALPESVSKDNLLRLVQSRRQRIEQLPSMWQGSFKRFSKRKLAVRLGLIEHALGVVVDGKHALERVVEEFVAPLERTFAKLDGVVADIESTLHSDSIAVAQKTAKKQGRQVIDLSLFKTDDTL